MHRRSATSWPVVAISVLLPSCAHEIPQGELRRQAQNVCFQAREQLTDWRLAAAECVKRVRKLDGVESAHVDGYAVKVKFEDFTDEYGIWIK